MRSARCTRANRRIVETVRRKGRGLTWGASGGSSKSSLWYKPAGTPRREQASARTLFVHRTRNRNPCGRRPSTTESKLRSLPASQLAPVWMSRILLFRFAAGMGTSPFDVLRWLVRPGHQRRRSFFASRFARLRSCSQRAVRRARRTTCRRERAIRSLSDSLRSRLCGTRRKCRMSATARSGIPRSGASRSICIQAFVYAVQARRRRSRSFPRKMASGSTSSS